MTGQEFFATRPVWLEASPNNGDERLSVSDIGADNGYPLLGFLQVKQCVHEVKNMLAFYHKQF